MAPVALPAAQQARQNAHNSQNSQNSQTSQVSHFSQLREVNEALVPSTLGANELVIAAQKAKERRVDLLQMMATESNDPFAPIRLAAATLGVTDAESALLARVREVLEAQAAHMARMVGAVLEQDRVDAKS